MIKKILFTAGLVSGCIAYGQTPVDVAESSIKVGIMGEEFFYFGFAEGDQLVFSFQEANGKELKEIEIVEMPGTSRFIAYKTSMITNKKISIPKTGIYKFRFTNSSIGARICNYKIQRIPAGAATQNFNCTVFTHTVNDTTYTTETEEYLSKNDTVITNFQDRLIKVNPLTTPGSNRATSSFMLPETVVAWSFYFTVNNAGQKEYEEAGKQLAPHPKFKNYGLLAALATNTPVTIPKLNTGEAIDYWVMEGDNANLFLSGAQFRYIKKGKAVNDFSRMEPRKGNLFFCFSNNTPGPVTITVKIATIHVNESLETRPVQRMHIAPKTKMYLKN
jgi:hypothetical protein